MKRFITVIVLILLMLVALTIAACIPQEATVHTLKYSASVGGSIEGQAKQKVARGQDGAAVTAKAYEGYKFVRWSDGVDEATRQDTNVQKDISVTAEFKKIDGTYKTITYLVEEGGTLVGETVQTIGKDETTKIVSVRVRDGYEFLGWSDGHNETWRSDSYYLVEEDTTFIAKIRRIDDYKLMNWYTEFGVGVPTIKITEETYDHLEFPIPTREHFTFEGWYLDNTLVADAQGNSYFTKEMLEIGERSITAKWTANETFTYKILLVYVTRIDATLTTKDLTSTIHVDYTISDLEREFYHWTTIRLKEYLDEIGNGLIEFQVDEYFTKDTVETQDFRMINYENCLFADFIPEVKDIIKEYDSAISAFSMNDVDYKLHKVSGSAYSRYAQVYLDSFYSGLNVYKLKLEQIVEFMKNCDVSDFDKSFDLDTLEHSTQDWLSVFSHELAHTIEMRINGDDYHEISVTELHSRQSMRGYYPDTYYYLQEVLRDGKKVGIPYEFWAGNILTARYQPSEGGSIDADGYFYEERAGVGQLIFDVPFGYDAPSVTAVPFDGYEFVEWSDGVKTITRTDLNITENLTVTAIFRSLTYELTIVAGEGGRLTNGEGTWLLQRNEWQTVKAEANEGYVFIGWSDGTVLNSSRTFTVSATNVRLFDENRRYTLTAIFVKIGEKSDYYVLNLIRTENGRYGIYGGLENSTQVLMKKDEDTLQVFAWAEVGYRFVAWSDGNTDKTRTFKIDSKLIGLSDEDNVITIYAIFEQIA